MYRIAVYAAICALMAACMAFTFNGCALYKQSTKLQGDVLTSIASTDESARAKCQQVAPKLLKAWPYFSGFYKGLKGPDGWKMTLSQQNQELWGELDKMAADYAVAQKISDYNCGYFITSKFTRLMPAILSDLTRNYASVPIVREMLDTYTFLNMAGVFG
jgi:hypothetical protein